MADQIHGAPCRHCPSAHFNPDPMALDILAMPHEERVGTVFACGWRPEAYCRGYCDLMGITENDLTIVSSK